MEKPANHMLQHGAGMAMAIRQKTGNIMVLEGNLKVIMTRGRLNYGDVVVKQSCLHMHHGSIAFK